MLEQANSVLIKGTKLLNRIAEIGIVALMVLVVGNVVLRGLFKMPITGTYEFVGFLTVIIIGFSIAYCAVQNGHIAVNFLLDKFPPKVQKTIGVLIGVISLIFWGRVSWSVAQYADNMKLKGDVSMTAKIALYPFVYVIAIGVFMLSLVVLAKLIETIRER